MPLAEQRAAIERLAHECWGDDVGQVIVGRSEVSIYPLRGTEPLLVVSHRLAVPAAIAALRVLLERACDHYWIETGRDTGDDEHRPIIFERCTLCGEQSQRTAHTLAELLLMPKDDEDPP